MTKDGLSRTAFIPYSYQRYCIDRVVNQENVGLWIAPGLGKTMISLMAIKKLKYEMFQVSRVLVIAPKKVAEATWSQEASKWRDTEMLRFSHILGTEANRISHLPEHTLADVYVINRENVVWLVEHYRNDWPFDMVVIDESSSFKSRSAKRFKSLAAVRPHIKRMVELTGTPSPNGLEDLWAQIYLLDGGERLGKRFGGFRNRYFVPMQTNYQGVVYKYALKPDANKAILSKLEDICVTMKTEDYLSLPDRVNHTIPVVLSNKAMKQYKDFEKKMILELTNEEDITVTSAAALTNKLLQTANGAIYDENGEVHEMHTAKVDSLAELAESLKSSSENAIVFYSYQFDKELIRKALKGYRVEEVTPATIKEWNDGKIDFLLAHPQSSGYGLNLQSGGNHVIWFGLPWNYEAYEQSCKRLHRQGQKHTVVIHHLVAQGTKDELVIKALEKKLNVHEMVMEELKADIAEVNKNGTKGN